VGDWFLGNDGRWTYDRNAPSPGESPPVTSMLPTVTPTPYPRDVPRVGDVGDWIDPNAPDPTSDEVTDRGNPDYVDPWFGP
jgi:hypothetical protein